MRGIHPTSGSGRALKNLPILLEIKAAEYTNSEPYLNKCLKSARGASFAKKRLNHFNAASAKCESETTTENENQNANSFTIQSYPAYCNQS